MYAKNLDEKKLSLVLLLNSRKICTKNLYTEKNGAGATLKWKRWRCILIYGFNVREKGFIAFRQ